MQRTEIIRKKKDNFNEYKRLRSDKNYIDVVFCTETGGLMATHKEHNFDKHKGHYEKEVQYIGFKYGNSVILESEKGNVLGKSYPDGLWNGKDFEIATSLGIGKKYCILLKERYTDINKNHPFGWRSTLGSVTGTPNVRNDKSYKIMGHLSRCENKIKTIQTQKKFKNHFLKDYSIFALFLTTIIILTKIINYEKSLITFTCTLYPHSSICRRGGYSTPKLKICLLF